MTGKFNLFDYWNVMLCFTLKMKFYLIADFAQHHQPSELTAEVGVLQNQHITQNPSQQPLLQQPSRPTQQYQQQQQQSSVQVQPAMSKNNEPVKLVYPSKIPNGTINLATIPSQQQQPNIMHTSTSMAANPGTNTVQSVTGQQPQTIVIKNQVRSVCIKTTTIRMIHWLMM